MPFLSISPWRVQFFQGVRCPDDVMVPSMDWDAWSFNPNHNWVYDKLEVALSQGLQAAPHGVTPPNFPVFSKPITNLCSMGAGSAEVPDIETYHEIMQAGHFWCTLLKGKHVSSDAAIVKGKVVWWRHTTGVTAPGGTFDYWHLHVDGMAEVEEWCEPWIQTHLSDYTGMANLETIGNRIIEVHLRFTPQWPDLYGIGWLDAVVNLYERGEWDFKDPSPEEGFSVILFGEHGPQYRYPSPEVVDEARSIPGVTSIQLPFHEDRKMEHHPNPPGGFRLAIINSTSLNAGLIARKVLADASWE